MRNLPLVASCLPLAIAAMLASPALAQTTLTVGTGQMFPSIGAAIAASNPGDTILVLGGRYSENLNIAHGLQLIGRNATLVASINVVFPSSPRSIFVHDLPASQSFVMAGFDVEPEGPTLESTYPVLIFDCAGPVAIANLDSLDFFTSWSMRVDTSPQVHVRASQLGMCTLDTSNVVFEDCDIGGNINNVWGVNATDGRTTVVGGVVRGVDGFWAAPAIASSGGTVLTTRTTLIGGAGFFGTQPASAIAAIGTTFHIDPSTVLMPATGAPPITGTFTQTNEELVSTIASTDGAQLELESHGPAGDLFATMLSPPTPAIATPFGATWVDPASASLVVLDFYGVDRLNLFSSLLPPLPPGLTVALQPVHFATTGIALGEPSLVTIP